MELKKAIQSRHSVRKFSNKKPDWRKIIECIDFARYAPMAGNNFTLKFILVDDEKKIEKIADACQQDFVSKVKYIVVACSVGSRTLNSYGERGQKYSRQQAGAAIQNFLLGIEESGLSTCWVGHFVDEQVRHELKIPADVVIEAIFPIGFEFSKPRTRHAKIDINRILYFNNYDESKMKKPKRVD